MHYQEEVFVVDESGWFICTF